MSHKSVLRFVYAMLAGLLLIAVVIAALWINAVWPYEWHLPEGIPLVLGFSTDDGVEDVIDILTTKFHVENKDVSVQTIKAAHEFLKKVPVRQQIVVEKFLAVGLLPKKIEFRFLHNRLMTIIFCPVLSDEECKTLLGEEYSEYKTTSLYCPGNESESPESAGRDRLLLVNWAWGTGVHSKLLWAAYVDWCSYKCRW